MIAISKDITLKCDYDLSFIGPLNEILFLDIETTGFTPDSSTVYLIGVVYYSRLEWHLKQWFADSLSSEELILKEFAQFVQDYRVLVTFNGDTFDIPYLKKCAAQYHLDLALDHMISFDLFRKIRPVKKLLSLEQLKQKSIEEFLGLDRYDQFNGGQLIEVYKEYLSTLDENSYRFLILHNEEDLKGLPQIFPILSYLDIFHRTFTLTGITYDADNAYLELQLDSEVTVPVPFTYEGVLGKITCNENHISLIPHIFTGELRYFFNNPKDYYYLPAEDEAIHKKVAQFVDKDYRQQATASTCYTKKTGVFLPLKDPGMFEPFYTGYRAKPAYIAYQDDNEYLTHYAGELLAQLFE